MVEVGSGSFNTTFKDIHSVYVVPTEHREVPVKAEIAAMSGSLTDNVGERVWHADVKVGKIMRGGFGVYVETQRRSDKVSNRVVRRLWRAVENATGSGVTWTVRNLAWYGGGSRQLLQRDDPQRCVDAGAIDAALLLAMQDTGGFGGKVRIEPGHGPNSDLLRAWAGARIAAAHGDSRKANEDLPLVASAPVFRRVVAAALPVASPEEAGEWE